MITEDVVLALQIISLVLYVVTNEICRARRRRGTVIGVYRNIETVERNGELFSRRIKC